MLISNISVIGWLHSIACLIALAAGAYALAARKGTPRHRLSGWWYAGAMVVLNLSVFFIYRFDIIPGRVPRTGPGLFGMFHWFAILALVSVAFGVIGAVRQRRSIVWAHVHAQAMLGSYYGLIGGLINEMFARIVPLRALALQLSPQARNITGTALVSMVQTGAMLLWFVAALVFFLQVARRHRRPDAAAFTIGHPLRYSGGFFSGCIGLGGIIGAFAGTPGWGFIVGAGAGLFLSLRAQRLVGPVWGQPSARQQTIRRMVIAAQFMVFMLLGSIGFFQKASPLATCEVTIFIVGTGFLLLRGSHGPFMLWLGVAVLGWLGAGMALHLPLPLLAIGDGLIKLGFGFAMAEPLLFVAHSARRARTSDGVAPASRRLASVTA